MPSKTKPKTKKAPSKAKVGGAKKRRFSTPVIILAVVVAVSALTVAGYFGYNKYQEHRLKAQAAGWLRSEGPRGVQVYTCKDIGFMNSPIPQGAMNVRFTVWRNAWSDTTQWTLSPSGSGYRTPGNYNWYGGVVSGGQTGFISAGTQHVMMTLRNSKGQVIQYLGVATSAMPRC